MKFKDEEVKILDLNKKLQHILRKVKPGPYQTCCVNLTKIQKHSNNAQTRVEQACFS